MKPTPVVIFRLGGVCLKIVSIGPLQYGTTIEKLLPPGMAEKHPEAAHLFSPQDISAIRKLTKEAEDALFNYQSMLLQVPHASKPADPKETNVTDKNKDNDEDDKEPG